jgi:flagellar hook-associated protein FlgK
MSSISSIALSGMNAALAQSQVSAHNVANAQTEGYQRQELQQTAQADGGVFTQVRSASVSGPALEVDLVSQLQAKNAFLANLAVFKTSNTLAGALLDQKA